MYDKFRVICCENKDKYPGKLFIDIYPADHITHELLYRMRLKLTPDVYDVTGGVYLDDLKNGAIRLTYIKHYNKLSQRQQSAMRSWLDPMIVKMYGEMKKRGLTQTIRASVAEACELFNVEMAYPQSAREENFQQEQERKWRRERIQKERIAYYAGLKNAANPHITLMIKQLERSGD